MKKRSVTIRLIALVLLCATMLPLLASCKSRAIPADKLALTEVGTVDGRAVYYEELYFLVKNYLPSLQKKHGDDIAAIQKSLDETVRENIVINYAMLRLCEDEGLIYDEKDKELKKSVQDYVDSFIQSQFDGSRSDYRKAIEEIGMTDHYLRFNAGVNTLYEKLPAHYGARGLLPVKDDEIRTYVKNNFARTWHVAVLVEEDESYEDNRAKAEAALAELKAGKSMMKMIGSTYNEDFSLTTTDGYYFPRGSMDKAYEDAVFALSVGQMSGIVESRATSNLTGNTVPCFYIIERLPLEDAYINEHLTALAQKCSDAIIAAKLTEVTDTLSFAPNDFYLSLDLTNLEAPGDGVDVPMILIISGIVLVVAGAATAIVVTVVRRKKKFPKLPIKK